MSRRVDLDHPRRTLLFYVVGRPVTALVRRDVRAFIDRLGASRDWVLGPPELVRAPGEEGEETVETIGGRLRIYSALPPLKLPRVIDLAHLEEVTAVMDAVQRFSRERNLTFAVDIDGESLVEINCGRVDVGPDEEPFKF